VLFNSHVFLFLFLPVTWILFRFACAMRITDAAVALLLIASLVFYSYWNPPFIFLILFSILFNFSWGRLIERSIKTGKSGRLWLYSGVSVNLLLIAYFKYANFFMANISWLWGKEWTALDIFLPLGISFFTFQQIAYLIDCSKGIAKGHAFTHYALFVTFFPQLIAGPIVRYEDITPQFSRLRTFALSHRNTAMGITLLTLGLFKKLVIADTLSPWVAAAFDGTSPLTFFEAWAGLLSYTFQIYFDFSGYSDMALGLGRLFNIELPINFNSPYKALSISDFWRRWHMTLSSFLRDYVYIPLGGNRKGELRRNINLMGTMLIGGLWHGASWNFVIWGGLHGVYLALNHGYRKLMSLINITPPRILTPIYWLVTFSSVAFAWVFFRAPSFSRAWEILTGLTGSNGVVFRPNWVPFLKLKTLFLTLGAKIEAPADWAMPGGRYQIMLLTACLLGSVILPNSYEWALRNFRQERFSIFKAVGVGTLLAVSICFLDRISEFLYFQF
jgi:alginate O-acetyltransferase complex protein AlgI